MSDPVSRIKEIVEKAKKSQVKQEEKESPISSGIKWSCSYEGYANAEYFTIINSQDQNEIGLSLKQALNLNNIPKRLQEKIFENLYRYIRVPTTTIIIHIGNNYEVIGTEIIRSK